MSKHLVSGLCLAASMLVVGGCAKNTVIKPVVHPTVELTANNFAIGWRANMQLEKGEMFTDIFSRDNVVVAYTNRNRAVQLNRSSGAIISQMSVGRSTQRLMAPLVMSDKTVFPTSTSLEIFDREGRFTNSITIGSPIRNVAQITRSGGSDLSLDSRYVYVAVDKADHGRIIQVDLKNTLAPITWEIQTDGPMLAGPVVYQSFVYYTGVDGHVIGVSEAGRPVWAIEDYAFDTGSRVMSDLRADEFGLYVASEDSKLFCIDRNKGKVKWQFYAGRMLYRSPEVTADCVYQPIRDRGVACIDKMNGSTNREPLWICAQADSFLSQDDTNAYLSRTDVVGKKTTVTLLVVDKKTGQVKSTSTRNDFLAVAPNTRDSSFYAITQAGEVLAIRPVSRSGGMGELVDMKQTPSPLAAGH